MKLLTTPPVAATSTTAPASTSTTPATTATANTSTTPAALISPVQIVVSRETWARISKVAGTYRIEPDQFLAEFLDIVAEAPPDVLMDAISEVARQTAIYHGRLATVARL